MIWKIGGKLKLNYPKCKLNFTICLYFKQFPAFINLKLTIKTHYIKYTQYIVTHMAQSNEAIFKELDDTFFGDDEGSKLEP